MAKVTRLVCDLCESEDDARNVTIEREPDDALRVDLCGKCYVEEFARVINMAKPPARRVRRSTFQVVEPL